MKMKTFLTTNVKKHKWDWQYPNDGNPYGKFKNIKTNGSIYSIRNGNAF